MPDGQQTLGNIEPIEIQEEMERSFLDYAMSVIVSRALPDVRDGLKPVHRRILYGMLDAGLRPDRQHTKCSRVVGHVTVHAQQNRRTRAFGVLGQLSRVDVHSGPSEQRADLAQCPRLIGVVDDEVDAL